MGKIPYGHWIPLAKCKPEDILKLFTLGNGSVTPEVLVPYSWGDTNGGGNVFPVYRYRQGKGPWKWSHPHVKPLVWMPIPNPSLATKIPDELNPEYDKTFIFIFQ